MSASRLGVAISAALKAVRTTQPWNLRGRAVLEHCTKDVHAFIAAAKCTIDMVGCRNKSGSSEKSGSNNKQLRQMSALPSLCVRSGLPEWRFPAAVPTVPIAGRGRAQHGVVRVLHRLLGGGALVREALDEHAAEAHRAPEPEQAHGAALPVAVLATLLLREGDLPRGWSASVPARNTGGKYRTRGTLSLMWCEFAADSQIQWQVYR